MTKIYNDGEGGHVALVAHGAGNEALRGDWALYGLLHYCIDAEGELEIFDGADDTFYRVDAAWEGLDEDVIDGLVDAFSGWGRSYKLDEEYYKTVRTYDEVLNSDLIAEALSGFYA